MMLGLRTAPILAVVALAACGGEEFTTDGAEGDAGTTGDPACADGTREGYPGEASIAACAGGFTVAGIVSAASRVPACGRRAGNDGPLAAGDGCSAADLCGVGYHVCEDATEVAALARGACPASSGTTFWLTRQAEDANGECMPGGSNNLVGCGVGLGVAAHSSCVPFDTELRYTHCQSLSTWECGTSSEANTEALLVTKNGPREGGVLCCKD
jgi:hypothetical protein